MIKHEVTFDHQKTTMYCQHESVPVVKNNLLIKSYFIVTDDGAYYFDEKLDATGNQGPLSATSSVVRGLTAFAAATSANLNVYIMLLELIIF